MLDFRFASPLLSRFDESNAMGNYDPLESHDQDTQKLIGFICLLLPPFIAALNGVALALAYFFEYDGWSGPVILVAATLVTTSTIPAGLLWGARRPQSPLARVFGGRILVAAGVVTALFWLAVPAAVFTGNLNYDNATPVEITSAASGIFAGVLVGALMLTAILLLVRGK